MVPSPVRSRTILSRRFGSISLDFLVRADVHECPYLPGKKACEEVFRADRFDGELYHDFMDHGFRRSGVIFYRPVCEGCEQCRPLRVPVDGFRPTKSQRRVWRKNEDLELRIGSPSLNAEKYRIYKDYLASQHKTEKEHSLADMYRFLYMSPVFTLEIVYLLRGRIVAVSIADLCSRSLSSVYVYFDPDFAARSPGTYSALREISLCNDWRIPNYYMGYLVPECAAMNYKSRFRPHEILSPRGGWGAAATATSSGPNAGWDHGIDCLSSNTYICSKEETTESFD